MAKPILCLDFDGVVHSYLAPWIDTHIIPDPPVPGALDFIRRAQEHFQVHIYSSRSATSEGCTAMQGWLLDHACTTMPDDYSWVYNIIWPETKPPALITLDDRVWCFTGSWPPIEELLKFKPWNKLGDRAGITVIPNVDAPRYMNLLRDHFKALQAILDMWVTVTKGTDSDFPTIITDALAKWPLEVRSLNGVYKLLYLSDRTEQQQREEVVAYAPTVEAPSDFKLSDADIPTEAVAQSAEQKD